MPRVLLVEDHPRLGGAVRGALEQAGIGCDVVTSHGQALVALRQLRYDALLLDRGLPDGDGLGLLAQVRAMRETLPCMILTARDALSDRVSGLDAGADDYLAKPFEMAELVARTRALLRRTQTWQAELIEFGDLRVDHRSGALLVDQASITLAPSELQIVGMLARQNGGVVRRAALEAAAWGLSTAVTPKALDVAIHRVRAKLRRLNSVVTIVNRKGVGYAMALAEDP